MALGVWVSPSWVPNKMVKKRSATRRVSGVKGYIHIVKTRRH